MGYKVKKIYVGTTKIRPNETKIVYFPLESDVLDHGPNHVSMTEYQSKSFTTLASGKKVIYSTDGWGLLSASNFVSTYLSTHKYTVRVWVNPTKNNLARRDHFKIVKNNNAWRDGIEAGVCTRETQGYGGYEQVYYVRGSTNGLVGSTSYNGWHHIVAVYDNGTLKVYINGSLYQTVSTYTISDGYLLVASGDNFNDGLHGYMSEFIIDSELWTADKALADYNATKSLYGL